MIEIERSRCAVLPLVLKGKWFDMIARGEKREEYRAVTGYWLTRFSNWATRAMRKLPVVEFRRGHAKDAPRMAFRCRRIPLAAGDARPYGIVIGACSKPRHPEWGEPKELHLVIMLGGPVTFAKESVQTAAAMCAADLLDINKEIKK